MAIAIVRTIAELEQLAPASNDAVLVQSYMKVGDGGGGMFLWNGDSTDASDGGTIIIPSTNPAAGRWERMASEHLNVRWFGAQGDWNEVTQTGSDDYDALLAAAAAINKNGGGTLIFPKGTYRIDRYRITGGPGQNGVTDIVFQNCSGLRISGAGAQINVKGDFHRPADYDIQIPLSDGSTETIWYSYSSAVQPFVFLGCENFVLEGLDIYGNVDKMTRDPRVVESPGSGIFTSNACRQYTLANIYVHHFETDGLCLGVDGPIADREAFLLNVRSLYNARNALSIISLRSGTFIGCEFSQSGRAVGEYGAHSPGAGLDIEPEVVTDVITGDLTFIECEFVNGTGSALGATGGESLFKRCLFWGTDYFAIIADAPKLVFEDCSIFGACLNWHVAMVADEPTKYIRCHFEDKVYPGTNKVYRSEACVMTSGGSVQLDDCVVIARETKGVYLDGAKTKHVLRNTTITHMNGLVPDGDFQSLLTDCVLDCVHFTEQLKLTPVFPRNRKGWYLDIGTPPEIIDRVIVDGPYVQWEDQNSGTRLNGNSLGNTRPFPRVSIQLNHNMNQSGPYQGYTTLGAIDGAPVAGTWKIGDLAFNQTPVAGGKVGWICVAGGAPGTWHAFGQIDP